MKFRILLILFLFSATWVYAQRTYSGNVLDSSDKRYLEGVEVKVKNSEISSFTNTRGYFNLKGVIGDTLLVSFPGFISQEILLSDETFLLISLQDRARFLPTFEVKAEPMAFRFKDGRLVLVDPDEEKSPSRKGEVLAGPNTSNPNGGYAISGPISYFTKKAKQAREYEKKKIWNTRREGYYAVIESDSVRERIKERYALEQSDWDELVIRFNLFHQSHGFLDWPEKKVLTSLEEFVQIERSLGD
ncbi:carboxypeptidase-like regulatory domain-containing protein [Algoriphagus sp. CAU 1675]|uniref:carboxypeptidase-like regulatory domain-containing protein n=1 Tax=Algoriphagus sp. CAU 1675 TaxID=3032597 RepID=UPI0023DACDDF|nr:carboxypeptidase-like regulatory domain-containing protein [Algoriphagus sp. CAU 1675]MDF2157843.1 carboxypeptidase-like regulatory domain-containing protein [Algoriphagus sp. CAU 1675]